MGPPGWDPLCTCNPMPWCCLATKPAPSREKGSLGLGFAGGICSHLPHPAPWATPASQTVSLLRSRLAAWGWGDGQLRGGVSPKILGRMDVNQSDGSECWTWLSSGCPPALHTMSPEHLWEQGLCLLPAAWEATTPSGGHQALAQPWAKTLAQLSSSLRQDPSQPSQTPGPVGNSKERGTGTPLFPFPDMALGTGRRLVPNVLQAGSHTRLHSSGTGQLKGEGANTVT